MSTIPFVKPRFTGSRFAGHTLPVDVARDLAAYESLLIALAKHLYLQENPERQRVPKGFSDAHLDIVGVEAGSARPVLALVLAGLLSSPFPLPGMGQENSYFSRARDLIAECVAAPDTALPEQFPKELLSHFNQLGRSLKEDETLELSGDNQPKAVLNPEKRRKLVLAASAVYERDVELSGSIAEADWEKSTFRLRLTDGNQAVVVPMPENFHDKVRQSGGCSRDWVFVKGVASYDSWDRLHKVISVESLEIIKNYPLATQFDDLAQLETGWYDGGGKAPEHHKLKIIAQKLIDLYPEQLLLPTIVPTQDGNLLLEWDAEGDPSVDINLETMRASFHAFGPQNEDREGDFNLGEDAGFPSFIAFLSQYVLPRPA